MLATDSGMCILVCSGIPQYAIPTVEPAASIWERTDWVANGITFVGTALTLAALWYTVITQRRMIRDQQYQRASGIFFRHDLRFDDDTGAPGWYFTLYNHSDGAITDVQFMLGHLQGQIPLVLPPSKDFDRKLPDGGTPVNGVIMFQDHLRRHWVKASGYAAPLAIDEGIYAAVAAKQCNFHIQYGTPATLWFDSPWYRSLHRWPRLQNLLKKLPHRARLLL